MAKAVLIVTSSPASPEQESDFNRWYDEVHVGQIKAAIPAITTVCRYKQLDVEQAGGPARYVAVYEMDSEDIPAALAALDAAMTAGNVSPTDTMDLTVAPPQLVWATGV